MVTVLTVNVPHYVGLLDLDLDLDLDSSLETRKWADSRRSSEEEPPSISIDLDLEI